MLGLRYRINDENKQKMQTVRYQQLLVILDNHVIIWHSPSSRIVFERGVQQRAQGRENDLLVWTHSNIRDSSYAFGWKNLWSHVHGLTAHNEEEPQDFRSVVLVLLC